MQNGATIPKEKTNQKKKKRFLYDNFSQTQKLKTQNQQFSSSSSVPLSKGSRHQWWRRILFLLFPTLFCFFLGIMLLDSDLLGGGGFNWWICIFLECFFFFNRWICGFVISRFVGFVLYWWICLTITLLLECIFFHSSLWQFFLGFLLCNFLGYLRW